MGIEGGETPARNSPSHRDLRHIACETQGSEAALPTAHAATRPTDNHNGEIDGKRSVRPHTRESVNRGRGASALNKLYTRNLG